MAFDTREMYRQLSDLDMSQGLTRDQIREQLPTLPDEVFMYLPASKRFYSADEVLNQTGEHALSRAEGEMVGPEFELPVEGATEDFGPPAYGPSLSPGGTQTVGTGDMAGPYDDIAGNSIQTSAGRGIPDES